MEGRDANRERKRLKGEKKSKIQHSSNFIKKTIDCSFCSLLTRSNCTGHHASLHTNRPSLVRLSGRQELSYPVMYSQHHWAVSRKGDEGEAIWHDGNL